LPVGSEDRVANFTELVGTAIANAESRAELTASRARVVTASDETRRRLERDLHDGVQQRLVSLALTLRAASDRLPPDLDELRGSLAQVGEGLAGALKELQEISRGIHPAILSEGGLGPALKTLARRAPLPVEIIVRADQRLPEPVEVAAYYVVAEALANVAKHADATTAYIDVESRNGVLELRVRDDGAGGADPARGSGLIGLTDRVEALGGTIEVVSPVGQGTALRVTLPVAG
jgi:signal transduction histidine kinase